MRLIPVHVAWNNEAGDVHKLTHVEFTEDCEVCAVETDVLDGDPITIVGSAFIIYLDEDHQRRNEGTAFNFKQLEEHTGNIMWDTIYMTPEECGRFGAYLQRQRHWTLNCSINEISADWGGFLADDFASVLIKAMDE